MGQLTIVSVSHDSSRRVVEDAKFGASLFSSIFGRGDPNIPLRLPELHYTTLGPQFHSHDTFLVSIKDGAIERLTTAEQIHLQESLARFRKKNPS